MSNFIPPGLGWQPGLPDPRDFTPETPAVRKLLSGLKKSRRKTLPKKVDLRQDGDEQFFSEVEHQQGLNCSCACAVVGLVEYFERRANGHVSEGSKLFLHHMSLFRAGLPIQGHSEQTDRLILPNDHGLAVSLRTTFKALVRFGLPPEQLWPYREELFHVEPTRLGLTGYAREYQSLRYFRIDTNLPELRLTTVKSFLAAGFPIAFGVPILHSVTASADIPYRPTFDSIRGGQAVLAIGYDDTRLGSTLGALLIRNSWGSTWGINGHGWLPYSYVKQQLAREFWTLVRDDFLQSGEFFRPTEINSG